METQEYNKIYLYRRIVQAKLYIDNNYAEKIDLNNISGEACFSKFHFIRLFKTIYGKTPHQYLISYRIEKAIQLLRAERPVTEVCFMVGFESVSSFSGLFKRIVGVSPLSFLTRHQQIRLQIAKKPLAFIPSCYAYQNGWVENSNFEEASL
jgi:AraC-like DNA-binding protein